MKHIKTKHGCIFMVEEENVVLPLETDIIVLPADESRNLILGWKVYEKVGEFVISNSVFNRQNGHSLIRSTLIE